MSYQLDFIDFTAMQLNKNDIRIGLHAVSIHKMYTA